MIYQISHQTSYQYETPASLCHNMAYLAPVDFNNQKVLDFQYKISPEPSFLIRRSDFFENEYLYFSIEKTHEKLDVEVQSKIETFVPHWISKPPLQTMPWEIVAEWLRGPMVFNDTRQFTLESDFVQFVAEIKAYTLRSFHPNREIFDAIKDLTKRIRADFKFTPGFTDISTPVAEFFQHKKGVCQDYAHFTLSCLRSLGLAAKYVSGYIETLPPPGKPKLVGADASHAWISVFIPDLGWVEFDPTNNLVVSDQHVRVAMGRDFGDITPLKGIVYGLGKQSLKVSVDVSRVSE